jgi:hypothetical protein
MENEFDIHFKKEGDTWTASLQSSTKQHQSTSGFGISPEEALKDLFLEKDKDNYQEQVRNEKE